MKHTSGPWEVANSYNVVIKNGGSIASTYLGMPSDKKEEAVWRANARLIAAAPELLEACKLIIDLSNRQPIGWNQLDPNIKEITKILKQLIAKAEGGVK